MKDCRRLTAALEEESTLVKVRKPIATAQESVTAVRHTRCPKYIAAFDRARIVCVVSTRDNSYNTVFATYDFPLCILIRYIVLRLLDLEDLPSVSAACPDVLSSQTAHPCLGPQLKSRMHI